MIELKVFSEEHLQDTFQWMQDAALRRFFLFNRTVTPESHRVWYERIKTSAPEKIYAILDNALYAGNLGLKNIDLDKGIAETWIYIGDSSAQGRGIAFSAYQRLFDLLKEENKIMTLYSHIASFNKSSIGLYTRLGFAQVLSFSEKHVWEGEEYDLLRFNKTL